MPRGVNTQDEGRIQGRNVSNANSSNIVSPGIVTDGLVLHLDAGNYNSYPIAGDTWYDISGYRNNGTLTNGPVYTREGGGAIDLTATSTDYVTGPITDLSAYTLCIFMLPVTFGIGNGLFAGSNSSVYMQFGGVTDRWQFEYANTPPALTMGTWTYLCGVQTSSSVQQAYKDGVLGSSATGSMTLGTSYAIGRRPLGPTPVYSNIKVAIAQIYDRALSGQEIAQNFNALRARFNI